MKQNPKLTLGPSMREAGYREGVKATVIKYMPVVVTAGQWMRNGHMIGCYHADFPEEGSPNCAIGCQCLRESLDKVINNRPPATEEQPK